MADPLIYTPAIPRPRIVVADAESRARELRWPMLRLGFWTLGVVMAAGQAFVFRNWINADSISYLDMSDAVTTGSWSRLVNGVWNPGYPFLLGVLRAIVHPSSRGEFAVAHGANVVSFLFAFVCFEFLLQSVMASRFRGGTREVVPLPRWAAQAIGYSLFLWGSIGLIGLMKTSPDMLMSGFVYLALGLTQRIGDGERGVGTYVALGLVLGLGYLVKTIMFPLSLILLAMTLPLAGASRLALRRTATACLAFALVAMPYVIAVSTLEQHWTFGDSGRVNELLYHDLAGPGAYWQSAGAAAGRFEHQPRVIFPSPTAYRFDRPIAVTTPLWYDPSYWSAGLRPTFQPRHQAAMIVRNTVGYLNIVWQTFGLVAVLIAIACAVGTKATVTGLRRFWPLWSIAIVALGAYASVHVEDRYIGAFIVMFWLALICGIGIPRDVPAGMVRGAVAAIVLTLAISTGDYVTRNLSDQLAKARFQEYEASVALREMGLSEGTHVARISPYVADGWARLARLTVIAEVQRWAVPEFWRADPGTQRALLHAFALAGAKAVVAVGAPATLPPGWRRVGTTQDAVYVEP